LPEYSNLYPFQTPKKLHGVLILNLLWDFMDMTGCPGVIGRFTLDKNEVLKSVQIAGSVLS
jgi:hypothetical protein